jgi:hypothetical protein
MITHGSPDIKSHGKLRGFVHRYLAIELNLLSNNPLLLSDIHLLFSDNSRLPLDNSLFTSTC